MWRVKEKYEGWFEGFGWYYFIRVWCFVGWCNIVFDNIKIENRGFGKWDEILC